MEAVQVKGMSPHEAWELLQSDPRALLIDVRSNMEFLFVGHPVGAVHVPWIDEPDWQINPHFVTQVRQLLLGGVCAADGDLGCVPVILICRSGKRSLEAGKRLAGNGFREVYNISEGFEGDLDAQHHRSSLGGWRLRGLPWEQC
ncbi:MAG: rhodanese-like domain-containing protein [Gammaproteobacteria bacterium]